MHLLQHLKRIVWRPARIVTLDWIDAFKVCVLGRWGRHAPVYRLSRQLCAWNAQRVAALQPAMHTSALTVQDVVIIRTMIARAATSGLDAVLQDQLFFLAVGAIQVQAQTGSRLPWHRFNQAMYLQLEPRGWVRTWSFGLVVSLCALWLTVSHMHETTLHKTAPVADDNTLLATGGTADPVTISLLQLAYSKMKSGTCQLPQAAMLPQAQREAYLLFVTDGTVDVEHVESLREALGYVNCLYPQALMRPQGRDRQGSVTMQGV